MAPDLNSVPPSPHPRAPPSHSNSTASSRRPSQLMGPPPLPLGSPSGLSHTHGSFSISPPVVAAGIGGVGINTGDNTGVGSGPGPVRHPRPLTPAELHLQLEKEQEAVVNRLTRELSQLRAQTASVASTASSTSTGQHDNPDFNASQGMLGPTHPTTSRRHRSSSSLSNRSITTPASTTSGLSGASTVGTTGAIAGSISGIALARDATVTPLRPSLDMTRDTPSRQNSVTSSISSAAAIARYEEAAHHRAELDAVKRENEMLRRRIRELERNLSSRRQSESSNASPIVSRSREILPDRSHRNTGNATDEIRPGESAASLPEERR
ncbi:MAG: hypothetical protein M1834_006676 [Cirrosporium novae-zelandiae]|nr:MAG: hypothetical protein M1834_006676 [Cirrosporium novae-zelandiae]